MTWSPSSDATAAATSFRAKLADVSVTVADTYLPKALFDAFSSYWGGGGAHTEGSAVAWASGSTAGHIEIGAAAPNGVYTSCTGCDEGGIFTFTAGINGTTGTIFTVHFATAFTNAPAINFYPGNSNAAVLFYNNQLYGTSTTTTCSLVMPSTAGLSNSSYVIYWHAKGSK